MTWNSFLAWANGTAEVSRWVILFFLAALIIWLIVDYRRNH